MCLWLRPALNLARVPPPSLAAANSETNGLFSAHFYFCPQLAKVRQKLDKVVQSSATQYNELKVSSEEKMSQLAANLQTTELEYGDSSQVALCSRN